MDNGTIKSKVLDNACSYPVYDDMGEYIAFIEHWTDAYTAISFWNVYYPTYVEHWDNEGGEMRLTSTDNSVGLPSVVLYTVQNWCYGISTFFRGIRGIRWGYNQKKSRFPWLTFT